ncbi:MAG: rhomboid family intramembrane serine protease, partial [Sphingobacteriaceae bacterium]
MAFGFTPKHEVEINLNGFDPKQYLAICLNTAEILKWRITYVSKSGFTAVIKKSLFSNSYEFKLVIINDLASIRCESLGSEMFDWGKNKAIVEQFTGTYENLQGIITDEEITNKLVEINGVFETEEEDALTAPPATAAENFKNFLSLFVPHPGYFVTPIIICINLAIFIAMVISGVHIIEPTGADLINWGANLRPVTLSGEWWRLISSNFLHIGVIHLLLNMYALLFIGILLEPHLGRVRYLSAYLITGVFASLVSIYWHDRTISAGAS